MQQLLIDILIAVNSADGSGRENSLGFAAYTLYWSVVAPALDAGQTFVYIIVLSSCDHAIHGAMLTQAKCQLSCIYAFYSRNIVSGQILIEVLGRTWIMNKMRQITNYQSLCPGSVSFTMLYEHTIITDNRR